MQPTAPVFVVAAALMMGSGSVLWERIVWNLPDRARLRLLLPCPLHIRGGQTAQGKASQESSDWGCEGNRQAPVWLEQSPPF